MKLNKLSTPPPTNNINIIRILRPKHWVKNLFIFLPLFFAQRFGDISEVWNCFLSFISFSLVASSIYVINDIKDAEKDRRHPTKRDRPIASGAVTVPQAILTAAVSFSLGITVLFFAENFLPLLAVILSYFVLNLAYTFLLKRYAIIDVCVIAIGFVLRIVTGGIAADVELSSWIILMTFLLAMFLGFAKRRDDVLIYENKGTKARTNIARYNEKFIDSVLIMTATITIVSYIMYCVSPEVMERMRSDKLYITSVFVIIGIIRYLQLTMVDNTSGSPTKMLFKDRFLQLVIIGWIASFTLIIYFSKLW